MEKITIAELLHYDTSMDIFEHTHPPKTSLIGSGLYCPLPLAGKSLIWGFHILKQAVIAEIESLECNRVDVTGKKELLMLALDLENRRGMYSWEEKERILLFLDEPDAIDETLCELIVKENPKAEKEKLLQFYNLAPELKKLVTAFGMEPRIAALASCFCPKALSFIMMTFGKLTFSEKRIFFEHVSEIFKRDNCLEDDQYSIVSDSLSSQFPIKAIEKIRYPILSSSYQKLEQFNTRYFKGHGIACEAPPYFEGESFTISFSISNGKNFSKKLNSLKSAEGNIDELFGLL